MEDVDRIILHFLRQLDICIPEEIKKLSELEVEVIIQSISKCLLTINPSLKIPKVFPVGISQRIEVAAQLAAMCKDLGYKNEVGYQTLLYYNESDLRQVFMFLIECLPSENDPQGIPSTLYKNKSLFLQNVRDKIGEELNRIWIPSCCKPSLTTKVSNQINFDNAASNESDNSTHVEEVNDDTLMKVFSDVKKNILKIHTHALLNKPPLCSEINVTDQNTNEDMKTKLKNESKKNLQELKEEVILLNQKRNAINDERTAVELEITKIQKANERAQAELNNIQNILIDLKSSGIPVEGGGEHILNSIKKSIEQLHTESDNCMMKNLTLKAEIEKNKKKLGAFESEKESCIKTLQSLKETVKSMKEEYLDKEKSRDQLKAKFEKLSKSNKRSMYTKRILEIINNVDKQKIEIKKILEDTRQIQKEINTLEAQLERSFSVADETLFKDAKKDDQAKKAYKLLALLHSECNTIVSLVNDTGTITREIVDLEDHIEVEKAKKVEETLKRIQLDLTMIQSEKIS